VEILIDGDGVVCLPRIVSASDPAFGAAAAQAVFGWQFKPPTKAGQPVLTRVRIPFEFEDKPNAPAEKAK
jgi:TonB family protein